MRPISIIAATLVFADARAFAEARRFSIQSKSDHFELVVNGDSGSVNGKNADLSAFRELIPMLTNPLTNDCPELKGAADITVKEGAQTRSFYLKAGVVSDGTGCLNVGGDGLMYFPFHRDFLIGAKHDSIPLKSSLKVFRQGIKVLDLKKTAHGWTNNDKDLLINWDFIERLENSLREFDIRLRVSPPMGDGKSKMIMQTGEQTLEFYKITSVLWAVKKPGTAWLEASDDWSFWYDFDKTVIEDRLAAQIRVAADATLDKDARLSALQKMEGTWSANLRDLYHKIVLNKDDSTALKTIAIKRLKGKPSKETAGVMAIFLAQTDDEDLRKSASQILKINYPKGPLYDPGRPQAERDRVIEYWSTWWQANQKTP